MEISRQGIGLYRGRTAEEPISAFDVCHEGKGGLKYGYLRLAGLPASPQDSFRQLSLSCSEQEFTLGVTCAEPFAQRSNVFLKDLQLTFILRRGARQVRLNGGVTLVLLDREIRLVPRFDRDGSLLFQPPAPIAEPMPRRPNRRDRSQRVGGGRRRRRSVLPRVFYSFNESGGDDIRDFSATGEALDLEIEKPFLKSLDDVSLMDGRLLIQPPGPGEHQHRWLIRSEVEAGKLTHACAELRRNHGRDVDASCPSAGSSGNCGACQRRPHSGPQLAPVSSRRPERSDLHGNHRHQRNCIQRRFRGGSHHRSAGPGRFPGLHPAQYRET